MIENTESENFSSSASTTNSSSTKSQPAIIEKFVIRLPNGLRTQIKELSETNRRSMNSEIIMVLEKHIQQNQSIEIDEFDLGLHQLLEAGVDDAKKNLELNRKLESLPAEKKEALLELLG